MRINSLDSLFVDIKKELIIYDPILLGELDETRPSVLVYSYSAIPQHLFDYLLDDWVGENSPFGDLLEHLEQKLTISSYCSQYFVEFFR